MPLGLAEILPRYSHLTVFPRGEDVNNINERLDKVRDLIQESEFLEGKGLSNEVNIRMFSYKAEEEMIVRAFVERISTDQSLKCNPKIFNLYEVFLSICDDKRITDRIPEMEEKKGKEFLLAQLKSIANNEAFVNKMYYEPQELGDVVILTGVGEVFPFMRIHGLLDSLQPHFPNIPILVFYPGTFDGNQVKLFDLLQPNSYYRAFNVI